MVAGDLVKFKFTFELASGRFIKPGDMGIVESKAMWYVNVLHIGSGEYITMKESSITKWRNYD